MLVVLTTIYILVRSQPLTAMLLVLLLTGLADSFPSQTQHQPYNDYVDINEGALVKVEFSKTLRDSIENIGGNQWISVIIIIIIIINILYRVRDLCFSLVNVNERLEESNLFSMLSPQWDDVRYEYNPVQGGQHHGEHHDEGGGVGGDRGEGKAGGTGETLT